MFSSPPGFRIGWLTLPQHTSPISLHAITSYDIMNAFPTNATSTIPEIAEKCGMHPDDATTMMRHGLARRLFLQKEDGRIAHSALTRAIVDVPNFSSFITGALDDTWVAAPFVVPAMRKWPGSQEPNQTAFNLAQGTDLPFFEELGKKAESSGAFADRMSFFMSSPGMSLDYAIEGYTWAAHKGGTIVDVGGSHGVVALKLSEKFPGMQITVQDRPEVVARAPKSLTGQVEFQAHDFFTEQPIKGADVYFFRWIFHDWSDKYCIAILRALIPALRTGSRVLMMEAIVPEPGTISGFQERPLRAFDMGMKELFNSKERSEGEWRKLLGDADTRFEVVDVLRPEGSQLGIIVVDWTG